jgi:hypothetical protein
MSRAPRVVHDVLPLHAWDVVGVRLPWLSGRLTPFRSGQAEGQPAAGEVWQGEDGEGMPVGGEMDKGRRDGDRRWVSWER